MSGFKDKILLITGGTGSFGNAVLRRFLDSDIKEIRIFSRDEKKQDDMRHHLQNPKVKFYIGNVRDRQSVDGAMVGVDYVFSAAALKQVPSCEFFPLQAVQTNVIGYGQCAGISHSAWGEKRSSAFYRQGGLPHQCHGYQQSHDGEGCHSQGPCVG